MMMNKKNLKSGIEQLNILSSDKKVALNMILNNTYYVSEALFLLTYKIW